MERERKETSEFFFDLNLDSDVTSTLSLPDFHSPSFASRLCTFDQLPS